MKNIFSFFAACGLLWLQPAPSSAEVIELNRQVLLPGDKPAAGAQVSVYVFDGTTTTIKEKQTLTLPADGVMRVQVDIPASPSETVIDNHMGRNAIYKRHYMVVDAPNAPVAIVPFHQNTHKEDGWKKPLRLEKGATITGKVVRDGQPVGGALVSMIWMRGILINSLDKAIHNPALQTTSSADGSFTFRPLILDHTGHPHDEVSPLCSLMAEKREGAATYIGTVSEVQAVPSTTPPNPLYNPTIPLGGTWSLRGTVVNELSRKPVEGAKVEIATRSLWPIAPATTNANGEWEIGNVPPNREVFAVATHPETSVGYASALEPGAPFDGAARQSRVIEGVEIGVKPLARMEGRVEEEGTGKMPTPMFPGRDLPNQIAVRSSWGARFGNHHVGGNLARAPIAADGTFSILVPVGEHSPGISIPGYVPVEPPTVDVPPEGLKGLVFEIKKRPAFYLRLESPKPDGLKDVSVVTIRDDGTEVGGKEVKNGIWYYPTAQWGDALKIRVKKGWGRDIKPVMDVTLTADPKVWPQVIVLPD